MGGHANGNMFGKKFNPEAAMGGHANGNTSVGAAVLQSGSFGQSAAGWSMGKLEGAISATKRNENYRGFDRKETSRVCSKREQASARVSESRVSE